MLNLIQYTSYLSDGTVIQVMSHTHMAHSKLNTVKLLTVLIKKACLIYMAF